MVEFKSPPFTPQRTCVIGNIKIERIAGTKYVRVFEDFWFYSDTLKRWSCIRKGFIYDEESVPIVKGSNPECGAIHDFLSRYDSDPVVTKEVAAAVYKEFQAYYDSLEKDEYYRKWESKNGFQKIWAVICDYSNRGWDCIRRTAKTDVVRIAPGYFHKYSVSATYEELADLENKRCCDFLLR